jgi:hypothetical protein
MGGLFAGILCFVYPIDPAERRRMKPMKHFLLFLAILTTGISSLYACAQNSEAFGIIEGHISIGPLVPVIHEGQKEPTPDPEVYASRAIVIYKDDGKTEFTRIKIDSSGNYSARLPIGAYIVDINHIGMDMAADLPKKIEITPQGITRLDIDIDTGIR